MVIILIVIALWLSAGYYVSGVITSYDMKHSGRESLKPEFLLMGIVVTALGLFSFLFVLLDSKTKGFYNKPSWNWPLLMLN